MKKILFFVLCLGIIGFSCKLEELEKIDPCAITPPKALFTPDKSSCTAPCSIQFTNSSQNATIYTWNFGDSTTSSISNPSHIFDKPGNYTVALTVSDENGCMSTASQTINIDATNKLPKAEFSIDLGTDNEFAPAKVKFSNTSSNADSYLWIFGDGQTITQPNPEHEYTKPGDYTVILKAIRGLDTSVVSKSLSIKIVKFEKYLNIASTGDDLGLSVKQTIDNGYIVAGRTGNGKPLIIKYDKLGRISWSRDDFLGDVFNDVVEMADGYCAVGRGANVNGSLDLLLTTINFNGSNGSPILFGGLKNEEAKSVIKTNDESLVVAGYTESITNGKKDAYLVKFSRFGTKIFEEHYGSYEDDEANFVMNTSDGGFILCGYSNVVGSGSQVYVVKTDHEGKKKWDLTLGGIRTDRGVSVVETTPGNFLVLGESTSFILGIPYSDAYLIQVRDAGNSAIKGAEYKYRMGNNSFVNFGTKCSNGDVVLVGSTHVDSSVGRGDDLYFLKVNNDGSKKLQEKSWGKPSTLVWGNFIQCTTDGGFIIVGGTPFGSASIDVYLVKTDSDGEF